MLSLGIETERRQMVVFDPDEATESAEAEKCVADLRSRGFNVVEESPGRTVLAPPTRDPHLATFRVLSENGDDRIVWDRRLPDQVREAFKKFREFLAKGYTAFVARQNGKRGHRIEDFDPGLEEIILVPSTMPG